MKIQFFGGNCFQIDGKKVSTVFDINESYKGKKVDIIFSSKPGDSDNKSVENKKILSLPGEYEISGALVTGRSTDERANNAFKVDIDDIVVTHLGNLQSAPSKEWCAKLGENVDVLLLAVSEKISEKDAKAIIDYVSPRVAIIGGDQSLFPKVVEACGAKVKEENNIILSRAGFSDESSEVMILSV